MFTQVHRSITMKKILSRKKLVVLLLLLALVGSLVLLLARGEVLVARDFRTKEVLRTFKLRDPSFTVAYTHSVMLSEVTESYRLEGGRIILVESTFKDYGAGLPSSTPYSFEFDEEEAVFRIYDINEEISPLVYRTGATRANHRLILGARELDFKSFSRKRQAVEFTVLRKSRLFHILNK